MLTLKQITENRDDVVRRLGKKHFAQAAEMIDQVITLDADRRATQKLSDGILADINQLSKSIGALMQAGNKEEATEAKGRVADLKETSKTLVQKMDELENAIRELLLQIPNLPYDQVPEGRLPEDNVVEKTGGVVPTFEGFEPLPHWELAKKYD